MRRKSSSFSTKLEKIQWLQSWCCKLEQQWFFRNLVDMKDEEAKWKIRHVWMCLGFHFHFLVVKVVKAHRPNDEFDCPFYNILFRGVAYTTQEVDFCSRQHAEHKNLHPPSSLRGASHYGWRSGGRQFPPIGLQETKSSVSTLHIKAKVQRPSQF